jgi:hypothetical protein
MPAIAMKKEIQVEAKVLKIHLKVRDEFSAILEDIRGRSSTGSRRPLRPSRTGSAGTIARHCAGENAEMELKDRSDLAEVLRTMTFGDLVEVARELVGMNADDPECNRHPETPIGMAQTLYDWAEAEEERDHAG